MGKVIHCIENIFLLLPALFVSAANFCVSSIQYLASRVFWIEPAKPNDAGLEAIVHPLPKHLGFADSLFQSCGLGTKYSATKFDGVSDWDEWMTTDRIDGVEDESEFPKFFVDYLDDPDPLIQLLTQMNATAYRFSFERSILQKPNGEFDLSAVRKYRALIQALKDNNIEPWGTSKHFVNSEKFTSSGGFENRANLDGFVKYSLKVIDIFPDVQNWMISNEPAVYGLQGYIRGVYPPGKNFDLAAAGRVVRNMLIAYYRIYDEAKKRHPGKQIGITHQWLKFKPFSRYNPLERLICYFMSKIVHYAVYNFFKTGHFLYQIPFIANIQLQVDDWAQKKRLDFIGVQSYGFPLIKAGFNSGETYPGYGIINWHFCGTGVTFGATCRKESHVQGFGPPFSPEDLEEVLDEADQLGVPIAITETGSDASIQRWGDKDFYINDEAQKQYFERILPILARFKLKAVFFWTLLREHLEWDRGKTVSLGVVSIDRDADPRRIKNPKLHPAAECIQSIFQPVRGQQLVA